MYWIGGGYYADGKCRCKAMTPLPSESFRGTAQMPEALFKRHLHRFFEQWMWLKISIPVAGCRAKFLLPVGCCIRIAVYTILFLTSDFPVRVRRGLDGRNETKLHFFLALTL